MSQQLRLSRQEAHDPLTLASKLRLHPSQRAVSRPVYAEEYEASLRECMVEGTPGTFVPSFVAFSQIRLCVSELIRRRMSFIRSTKHTNK